MIFNYCAFFVIIVSGLFEIIIKANVKESFRFPFKNLHSCLFRQHRSCNCRLSNPKWWDKPGANVEGSQSSCHINPWNTDETPGEPHDRIEGGPCENCERGWNQPREALHFLNVYFVHL